MKHLTIQQLHDLGFIPVKNYFHDEFMTSRHSKGVITVETTWRLDGPFENQYLSIEQIDFFKFTENDLKQLDKILNKDL